MKRISTVAVAAATAISLTVAPAFAEENAPAKDTTAPTAEQTPGDTKDQNPQETPDTGKASDKKDEEKPGETEKPGDSNTNPGTNNNTKTSGSSKGHALGAFAGILAAVLTTGLIVLSDPTGLNKLIDMANAQFHLGLGHVHVPKVF